MKEWIRRWLGMKPQSVTPEDSNLRLVLKQQHTERMEFLSRLAAKDSQIGMVLDSRFEKIVMTERDPEQPGQSLLPLSQLMDVPSDEQFIGALVDNVYGDAKERN
jgi:hypothetical protein